MQTAGSKAAKVAGAMKSGQHFPTSETPAGPTGSDLADAVNRVFALFEANWPRRFTSIWPSADAVKRSKRLWAVAFRDARLTPARLAAGLRSVRQQDWPPDNPGGFLILCCIDPASVGAPDHDAAFAEAIRGAYPYARHRWSHRCVYWAAVRTGLDALNERQQAMAKTFAREYQEALEQAGILDDAPRFALPKKTTAEQEAERQQAAKSGLAALKKQVGEF